MTWLTGERWPVVPSSTSTLFVCPWLLTVMTERKSTSKCLGQNGTLPSPGLSLWWGGHYLSHVIFLNQFTDRLWPRVPWRSQKCAVTLRQCFKSVLNWLTAFQRIRTFNVTILRFHGFFQKKIWIGISALSMHSNMTIFSLCEAWAILCASHLWACIIFIISSVPEVIEWVPQT